MALDNKQFNIMKMIKDNTINISSNDVRACKFCRKNIPLVITITVTGFHKDNRPIYKAKYDRSNRIDCDESEGDAPAKNITYHPDCYMKVLLK